MFLRRSSALFAAAAAASLIVLPLPSPLARADRPASSVRRIVAPPEGGGGVSVIQAPPAAVQAPAPGSQPVGGAFGGPGAPSDDPASELLKIREEQSRAYQSLNALNPFSADYGKAVGGGAGGATATTGPLAQLQKLLSQPAVQGYLRLFSNPAFSEGIDQVIKSPNRMVLLYAELGWIVFMLVLRAWRFSKSMHWAARLWTRLWTFALFVGGAVLLVPIAVLGEPYYRTVSGMLDVVMKSR